MPVPNRQVETVNNPVVLYFFTVPRLKKSPVESKPTDGGNDEIYDEIDTRKEMEAKQKREKAEETGYEVNIAMATMSSTEINDPTDTYLTPRAASEGSADKDVNDIRHTYFTSRPSDGSAYEDVNVKRESSEYQGLDLDNVDKDQPYADLN